VRRDLAIIGLLSLAASAAHADIFGNTFRSDPWGVELTVPRGWELSEQRSYPGIIARGFEHRTGARLLLAAEKVPLSETLKSYAERNQKALQKLGYRVTGVSTRDIGAIVLDAATPDKRRIIRQAYFVSIGVTGGTAFVLTVGVKADAAKSGRPFEAFDEAMRTINIAPPDTPIAPAASPPEEPAPASQPVEKPPTP
jgi:hypothetical protein